MCPDAPVSGCAGCPCATCRGVRAVRVRVGATHRVRVGCRRGAETVRVGLFGPSRPGPTGAARSGPGVVRSPARWAGRSAGGPSPGSPRPRQDPRRKATQPPAPATRRWGRPASSGWSPATAGTVRTPPRGRCVRSAWSVPRSTTPFRRSLRTIPLRARGVARARRARHRANREPRGRSPVQRRPRYLCGNVPGTGRRPRRSATVGLRRLHELGGVEQLVVLG